MQYKTFSNLLHNVPDLNKFVTKLEQLEQISHFVAAHLEPDLASQCRVANLRDGALILSTTSPAWNHKLRFIALDLLSALRTQPCWSGLKSIEVRVDYLPNYENNTTTNLQKPHSLSQYNAKLIQETANGVTCGKLSQALKRLASRATRYAKHEN
ncbi:MAG TPA: DciA family protein [Gammaproteobacteria bacterium]|nr:DciA family protein [Gammaproteobacteria bacterium]